MSNNKFRLRYITRSTASEWATHSHIATDPSGSYIYTAGTNGSSVVYIGGWTYSETTGTITRKSVQTVSGGMSGGLITGLDANYRGCAATFYANDHGLKVYTFDGTTLTLKAESTWNVQSPKLNVCPAFRKGVNSDDLLIANNTLDYMGRLLTYSWDGSTTLTTGVLYTSSAIGSYTGRVTANANYFSCTGYTSSVYFGTFSTSGVSVIAGIGISNPFIFMSPNTDRLYIIDGTSVLAYDLSGSGSSLVATISPGLTPSEIYEDNNGIVYIHNDTVISAYTYSGSTYKKVAEINPPFNTTFGALSVDSNGNVFVLGSDKRVYVMKGEWYTTNPILPGQLL